MRHASRIGMVVAGTGIASAAYQAISEARDRRRFPPLGQLVDISGRSLHMVSKGEGTPVVVIIPALADNVLGWLPVLEGVAAKTQAIVYDRAEVGWSDPPPNPRRTTGLMAADLRAMLHAARVPPPYVLVGHSVGGIVARRFYARYADEVAGIVLVDSSHEQQKKRIGAEDWRMETARYYYEAVRWQARILGVRRVAAQVGLRREFDASIDREAPPGYRDAHRAICLSTRRRRVAVQEMLMFARELGEPPSLGSVPLTVITRAPDSKGYWPVWAQLQAEMAALSTDNVHVRAETGGHYLQRDEPDLVIQAINDLVKRVNHAGRTGAS